MNSLKDGGILKFGEYFSINQIELPKTSSISLFLVIGLLNPDGLSGNDGWSIFEMKATVMKPLSPKAKEEHSSFSSDALSQQMFTSDLLE